jgi:uncharacterized protein (TIGR02217 family)
LSFFETEFPRTLSYQRMGGPTRNTTVNQGLSGQEQRNKNWVDSRGEWEIALKTPAAFDATRQAFIDLLIAFFEVVGGQADGFRLFDHIAFRATSQPLVNYNGHVQLALTRSIGSRDYVKIITKPITSAVTDYQGNALPDTVFLAGTNTPVTVDSTTGIVIGTAAGTPVDFQYHIPVRFGVDKLPIVIEESDVKNGKPLISMNSVPILEVLPPNY